MQLTEFLGRLSVAELKDLAEQLDVPPVGKKRLLVARVNRKVKNPFEVLPLLKNDTLREFCRDVGAPVSGTKDELVAALIRARVLDASESQLSDFILGTGISDLALRLDLAKTLRTAKSVSKVAGLLRHSDDRQVRAMARRMTKVGSEVKVSTLVHLLIDGKEEEIRSAAVALEGSMELAGRSDAVQNALTKRRESLRSHQREIEAAMGSSWRGAPQLREVLVSLWKVDREPAPEPSVKLVEKDLAPPAAPFESTEHHSAATLPAQDEGQELVLADLQKLEPAPIEVDLEVAAIETKMLDDRLEPVPRADTETGGVVAAPSITAQVVETSDRPVERAAEQAPANTAAYDEFSEGFEFVPGATVLTEGASVHIDAGSEHTEGEMEFIHRHIESSLERVVAALEEIAGNRDLVLKKRLGIKRDLGRLSRMVHAREKAEFLKRAIGKYGHLVNATLHSLLKRGS